MYHNSLSTQISVYNGDIYFQTLFLNSTLEDTLSPNPSPSHVPTGTPPGLKRCMERAQLLRMKFPQS